MLFRVCAGAVPWSTWQPTDSDVRDKHHPKCVPLPKVSRRRMSSHAGVGRDQLEDNLIIL